MVIGIHLIFFTFLQAQALWYKYDLGWNDHLGVMNCCEFSYIACWFCWDRNCNFRKSIKYKKILNICVGLKLFCNYTVFWYLLQQKPYFDHLYKKMCTLAAFSHCVAFPVFERACIRCSCLPLMYLFLPYY